MSANGHANGTNGYHHSHNDHGTPKGTNGIHEAKPKKKLILNAFVEMCKPQAFSQPACTHNTR